MRLKVLFVLLLIICIPPLLFAQIPIQTPLTGNIGLPGSAAILGDTTVQMPADTNYTLTAPQWANKTLIVTSAVALTATCSIIGPLNKGQEYNVENLTQGAQSITVIGEKFARSNGRVSIDGLLLPTSFARSVTTKNKRRGAISSPPSLQTLC